MSAAHRKQNQETPQELESSFQQRLVILDRIESKQITAGPHGSELRSQELRHLLRERNYRGDFLLPVCDHCYSDLWQPKDGPVTCPGCGWLP